jgi:hypothetical protein
MPPSGKPARHGMKWTRDELVLALELYCRIPFGHCTHRDPHVRRLAGLLQRTPDSVAFKLGNLGALDPTLKERGVGGLPHGARCDRETWNEFAGDLTALSLEAARVRAEIASAAPGEPEDVVWPTGPSEAVVASTRRRHQAFFRDAVLSSYEGQCCITGLPLAECLIASHIVPWREKVALRADPRNGLCLSATFHHLFDAGYITVRPNLAVHVSRELAACQAPPVVRLVDGLDSRPIARPTRFSPSTDCLAWHNAHVFRGAS